MDPDLVRLLLVVFGFLLVVGIYLWDRYKRAAPRRPRSRRSPAGASIDHAALEEDLARRGEPSMDQRLESIPEMRLDQEQAESRNRAPAKRTGSSLDPEPAELGKWSPATRDRDPQFSMDLNFDAQGDGDHPGMDPALYDKVERKIVIVNLVARGGTFSGVAIEKVCKANGLLLGDMSIYHRLDGASGRVLFSVVSMVEPGSFPADGMAGFATPGLSFFTQLPGVRDGVQVYDEMLATATRMATALQGELQDERHNKLTRQMEKHTRESIIEHRRKLKLARSRR